MESNSTPDISPSQPMAAWRIVLVNGLIVFLILAHLYDIKVRGTHWPFSQYDMFSKLSENRSTDQLSMVGVTTDGKEIRISDPQYAWPLPSYHARLAFMTALRIRDPAKRQPALDKLSADYLRRYDLHRATHGGPAVTGMRLYEIRWNSLDPWAQNANQPDEKELLFDSHPPATPSTSPTTKPSVGHISGQRSGS